MRVIWFTAVFVLLSLRAQADTGTQKPADTRQINLSGPRIGFTMISHRLIEKLEGDLDRDITPIISQFGWHMEHRFFTLSDGLTGVSEFVLLAGGFEQDLIVPSLTWMLGIRSGRGVEFGMGPNLSPAGSALVLAWGFTLDGGGVYFPMNVALASNQDGVRVSLLLGFNRQTEVIPHPHSHSEGIFVE